jgi:hypothetical protein
MLSYQDELDSCINILESRDVKQVWFSASLHILRLEIDDALSDDYVIHILDSLQRTAYAYLNSK